jgi:hypothetical protein
MVRRSTDPDLKEKDAKLLETLEQWGWFVTKVSGSGSDPAFAYSMGLYENFKHPEIIIFGLELGIMHQLINDAGKRIRQGHGYKVGQRYDDLLKGYQCQFRKVNPIRYDGLLNCAIWYYKGSPFPVLQLVWPDQTGLFPWENGFDERIRKRQLNLE